MNADTPRDDSTLGDLVLGLRAGEPCPWCGYMLHSGRLGRQARGADRHGQLEGNEATAAESLVCPMCGCEVSELEADPSYAHTGMMGVAA